MLPYLVINYDNRIRIDKLNRQLYVIGVLGTSFITLAPILVSVLVFRYLINKCRKTLMRKIRFIYFFIQSKGTSSH